MYVNFQWEGSKIWRCQKSGGKNFGSVFFDVFRDPESESALTLAQKKQVLALLSDY